MDQITLVSHTGCSGKIVFFPILCNPSLAYIWLQNIFKVLITVRMYSRSKWLTVFWTTNSIPVLARERWQILKIIWKTYFFLNTLYIKVPVASRIMLSCIKAQNWISGCWYPSWGYWVFLSTHWMNEEPKTRISDNDHLPDIWHPDIQFNSIITI